MSVRLVLTCIQCHITVYKPGWYVEVVPAGSPTSLATVESGVWQIEREVGKTAGIGHVLAPLFQSMLSGAEPQHHLTLCLELQWVVSPLSALKESLRLTAMKTDDEEW